MIHFLISKKLNTMALANKTLKAALKICSIFLSSEESWIKHIFFSANLLLYLVTLSREKRLLHFISHLLYPVLKLMCFNYWFILLSFRITSLNLLTFYFTARKQIWSIWNILKNTNKQMNPSALKTTTILENSGCKRKGDKGDPV